MKIASPVLVFIAGFISNLALGSNPENSSLPHPPGSAVIDLSRYDLATILGVPSRKGMWSEFHITEASGQVARQVINFRYMRSAGLQASMFQSSYIYYGHFKADDSFRVWAADGAANGVMLGAYHFYRSSYVPTHAGDTQASEFLAGIAQVCADSPNQLRGKKILLAFDAQAEPIDPVIQIHHLADFARQLHTATQQWPGFYPENDLKPIFAAALAGKADPNDILDLQSCWYWASRYQEKGPEPDNNSLFFGIWRGWTFWQYCASETWYPSGQHAIWNPSTEDPKAFAQGKPQPNNERSSGIPYDPEKGFVNGVPGAAISLDCNFFQDDDPEKLRKFWNEHGWVPPSKSPMVGSRYRFFQIGVFAILGALLMALPFLFLHLQATKKRGPA